MKDRGMIKWRPFNSVVPNRELFSNEKEPDKPALSKDELEEYEEILKWSFYTGSNIEITYLEKNKVKSLVGIVVKIDSIKKNIYLNSKVLNFRQIYRVKKK